MLAELSFEELAELTDTLWRGWSRAYKVYGYNDDVDPDDFTYEAEKTHHLVANEYWGRHLGCQWKGCSVCRHESCAYCPTCNPGDIAPNGESYDDVILDSFHAG